VLKWARENDCPWNVYTTELAAGGGHLEVLQWAIENDCDATEFVCERAAMGGHFDVLVWAHENGFSTIWESRKWIDEKLALDDIPMWVLERIQ
jgi:hypothetical protein